MAGEPHGPPRRGSHLQASTRLVVQIRKQPTWAASRRAMTISLGIDMFDLG